jgi:hypothetical protein
MKNCLLILPLLFILFYSVSCQKEIPDIVNITDTTVTGNTFNDSFKIVQVRNEYDNEVVVTNIQYDTAGKKINLYYDDTTTANPYDELAYQYTYSPDGYLLSVEAFPIQNFDAVKIMFERDAAKRLVKVTRSDISGSDVTLVKYQSAGANTIVYEVNSDSLTTKYQRWITYNSNNQYTSIIGISSYPATADTLTTSYETYLYNADGSLQQKILSDSSYNLTMYAKKYTLSFTSYELNTPPVFNNFTKIVLGKDWHNYILQYEAHPFIMMLANQPVQPDVSRQYEEEVFYGLAKPLKSAQISFTQPSAQQDNWIWDLTKDSKNRITVIEQKISNVVIDRWKIKYAL